MLARLMRSNEPTRCETGSKAIVYSVRIGPRNYESLSFQQVLSNPQPSELTISECQSNTSKRDERQE